MKPNFEDVKKAAILLAAFFIVCAAFAASTNVFVNDVLTAMDNIAATEYEL